MKQPQYQPVSVADQAVTLFAANRGYFDDVPVEKALAFEHSLRQFLRGKYAELHDRIVTTKDLTADDEKALAAAIVDFKKTGTF
jgi:F-type H+-transporting ATPase subunit alpha